MRAMINKGCAFFYAGVFLLAALMGPLGIFVQGLEATLVTVSSDTVLARPVDWFEGDDPWVTYRYEVEGQSYEGTHSISHSDLRLWLELEELTIEHSRQFPRFSRLEKPSFLGLVGILLFQGIGALLLFVLGLGGALGMFGMAGPAGEIESAEEILEHALTDNSAAQKALGHSPRK